MIQRSSSGTKSCMCDRQILIEFMLLDFQNGLSLYRFLGCHSLHRSFLPGKTCHPVTFSPFYHASFSLCSNYWSLNKHTIRLAQLRIKSLVLDLVLIFYYLYCLQNRVRVEFIVNHLVRSVHSFILQMLIEVWCWELRDRGTWRGSSVIFTLTHNGRYAACGFLWGFRQSSRRGCLV